MIGAAERNKSSVGVDINPLAVFATEVKLTPLSIKELDEVSKFIDSLNCGDKLESAQPWPKPALSIADKVFEPEILSTLMKIRSLIEEEFSSNDRCRNLLKLGWLSIMENVGSYYKEGNGIKYRNKKRSKGRYENRPEGEWQITRFGKDQPSFTLFEFTKQIELMLSDTRHWNTGNWQEQKVHLGSSRFLYDIEMGANFDSIIFSPPYANRFDYFEALKVELWFGNFINSYEEGKAFRKLSTRSHLGANFSLPAREFEPLKQIISQMDNTTSSWKMGVEGLLYGYFDDMFETLKCCFNLLSNGECHVVVGNSAFAGAIVPTDSLIAMLGLEAGFKSVRLTEARHLTVAPQQRNLLRGYEHFMRESVVSFSK